MVGVERSPEQGRPTSELNILYGRFAIYQLLHCDVSSLVQISGTQSWNLLLIVIAIMPFSNMRLNADSMESPDENHEMLETENRGVAGRVADLERKVLEQGDELVCLKATLAEVLRRLNVLEGMRNASSLQSTPSTPVRINGNASYKDLLRNKSISYSASKAENGGRKYAPSSLPQRRAVHYQSTGSLHSDSQSSSSVSPIPSPSPSSGSGTVAPSQTLHKRWSSTGDFNQSGATGIRSNANRRSMSIHWKPKLGGKENAARAV
ncbi:hypothetical protein D910_06671 [Dendroctonus ponderosae]|uniref:Echinoderm microtubule-associated protein-like 1 n=1 Tax=Dendroctonus ponderosae TaxID=77166 RepID=U4U5Y1_DENPD|nr:hypothetical protein D910_06671 [Dendroctonus ponderosae]